MRYISTRGGIESLSFSQAVMMGLSTDGGLLLPETIPHIDAGTLKAWSTLSFTDLATEVISLFSADDIDKTDIARLTQAAYASFDHPEITPLVQVGSQSILELFHGPTAAFKDVALQFLGHLFEYLLERDGGQLNIVGATSGDTGSAAIYGVRGKAHINIFILFPNGRVSPIQERQMTTVLDKNVHNLAIKGTFDDGQRIVKALFNDLKFKKSHHLGAVNSINWARIVAQIVYYFYAWGKTTQGDTTKKVSFSIPTGNFGDIFAGYMAKRMGLPVDKLILATNRNDILTRFVHSGTYQAGEVVPTVSPSMDIQIASNFERYLYYLFDGDSEIIKKLMADLTEKGQFSIADNKKAEVQALFKAVAVSEAETLQQIKTTFQQTGYILDPHTAVGVKAAENEKACICLATADPAKFADAIQQAIQQDAPPPKSLQGLMEKETRVEVIEADSDKIKAFMEQNIV